MAVYFGSTAAGYFAVNLHWHRSEQYLIYSALMLTDTLCYLAWTFALTRRGEIVEDQVPAVSSEEHRRAVAERKEILKTLSDLHLRSRG